MNTRFNPRASGGIGFHFEHYVQATYLLSLITKTPCEFDSLLTVEQLELQAGHAYYTDDAVVTFNNGTMLHIQCKMSFKINNSSRFVTTIIAMWKDHVSAQLSKKETRFLISTDKLSAADARTGIYILVIARDSADDANFFKKIGINKGMYEKFLFFRNAIMQHTADVDNYRVWNFLRSIYVEEKDFTREASVAERNLELQIQNYLGKTGNGRSLLNEMLVYLSQKNGSAATINSSTIDRRLYFLFDRTPKELMPNLIETGLANRDRYMLLLSLVSDWVPLITPLPPNGFLPGSTQAKLRLKTIFIKSMDVTFTHQNWHLRSLSR